MLFFQDFLLTRDWQSIINIMSDWKQVKLDADKGLDKEVLDLSSVNLGDKCLVVQFETTDLIIGLAARVGKDGRVCITDTSEIKLQTAREHMTQAHPKLAGRLTFIRVNDQHDIYIGDPEHSRDDPLKINFFDKIIVFWNPIKIPKLKNQITFMSHQLQKDGSIMIITITEKKDHPLIALEHMWQNWKYSELPFIEALGLPTIEEIQDIEPVSGLKVEDLKISEQSMPFENAKDVVAWLENDFSFAFRCFGSSHLSLNEILEDAEECYTSAFAQKKEITRNYVLMVLSQKS